MRVMLGTVDCDILAGLDGVEHHGDELVVYL